jgi:hypothetical protein
VAALTCDRPSPTTTELVYRKQIRPVIQTGAVVVDDVFGSGSHSHAVSDTGDTEPGSLAGGTGL